MKFGNDYLKELLGVQVCKLEFNLSHNDRWYYPLGEEPQALCISCEERKRFRRVIQCSEEQVNSTRSMEDSDGYFQAEGAHGCYD